MIHITQLYFLYCIFINYFSQLMLKSSTFAIEKKYLQMKENIIEIKCYLFPCGKLVLGSFEDRLCLCDWLTEKHHNLVIKRLEHGLQAKYRENNSTLIKTAVQQLDEYFVGKRKEFNIPLLLVGSDFQKRVWKELLTIPYGTTLSYKEISQNVGRPKAVRAVANAVGANSISIFLPCHRVIGSNNSLTGYAGGLEAKQHLLELENSFFKL